ncbi:hypothetical protein BGC_23230 [Burkholderia sp. 3C]
MQSNKTSREKMRLAEPRAATRKPDTFTGWLGALREGRTEGCAIASFKNIWFSFHA